jgi:glycosyltransferase involved in cell wall biosynthesis
VLIAAVARLRKRVPDVQLVLKHPEPSVPTPVATAVARSGLGDAVRVIGHVSEDELAAMFRAADVAVSIPLSDSSPRSAWEALASGIPLVVSDLPWARDELAGADAAVLVAGTVEDVEAGIAHVLTDAAAAGSLALAGRRLAERLMDVNAQFARVDALYRKLGSNEG